MAQGRVRREFLAQRAAHQQIAGVGDERHDGDFQIGRIGGDGRKTGVFACRCVVEYADQKALKGIQSGVSRRDAQRERDRQIAQPDGDAVAHAANERGRMAARDAA